MSESIVIGTRGSRLALWQARRVRDLLLEAGLAADVRTFVTKGDRETTTPLPELGDKALFTAELDRALLEGSIHLAVHSAKDLPTDLADGLVLAAVPERAEPWDVLVARDPRLREASALPEGATVATSSLRRSAQLLAWRPDLRVVPARGNVETRVQKLHENGWDGAVLAEAGLRRLGMAERISARLPEEIVMPAVSQGALGVVAAADAPGRVRGALQAIDDARAHRSVLAERAFLRRLEGGCQVPIGALAVEASGVLEIRGIVVSLDGTSAVRGSRRLSMPAGAGTASADGDSGAAFAGGGTASAAAFEKTGTASGAAFAEVEKLGVSLAEDLLSIGAGDILRGIRTP